MGWQMPTSTWQNDLNAIAAEIRSQLGADSIYISRIQKIHHVLAQSHNHENPDDGKGDPAILANIT